MVAQVALSLLLLIGAGLFTRSLMNLRALDPGFKPDRLFAFDVDPARSGQDFTQRVATLRRIQEELLGGAGRRVGVGRGGHADERQQLVEHACASRATSRRRGRT